MEYKTTVLIVDDNSVNRLILKKVLMDEYAIVEAENGKVALDLLQDSEDEIGAVLLDLVMPVMDGYEFLKILKGSEEPSNIPVIVSAVNDDKENEKRAFKLGACDFISKPYDVDIIKYRLKNAIDRSQLAAFKKLEYLADHDELTGIYNKKRFYKDTHRMLLAHKDKRFVFLRTDIDKFNLINSFYGIDEGDRLLTFIAGTLMNYAAGRREFTYGRIEADIFAMCFSFEQDEDILNFVDMASKKICSYNRNYNIIPIFGLYKIDDHRLPVDQMFDRANLAAKGCKGQFIESCAFYTEEMGRRVEKEQEIVNEMNDALTGSQFVVYYQPKYHLHTRRLCGAEALVRWNHPSKGIISPGEFIPVFERNGFIAKLDYYVWRQVCKYLKSRIDAALPEIPISVNVSRVNLYNPKLTEKICGLADEYGIPHNLLNLELTESAYMDNPVMMKETMARLQKKGFIILMDDFGSGYSSLNVLKDIPVDILKIDMKFLSTAEIVGRGENILASVIRMAKWIHIPTVAEGVEKQEQVEFLNSIGCDYVQGFYFARPMPLEEFIKIADDEAFVAPEDTEIFDTNSMWYTGAMVEGLFSHYKKAFAAYEYGDGHLEILRVNNAFYDLFGRDDRAIQSSSVIDVVDKNYRDVLLRAFEEAEKTKGTTECTYLRTMNSGRKIWINILIKYINKIGNKSLLTGTLIQVPDNGCTDEKIHTS